MVPLPRILFVDDELFVLDGLRRTLRPFRSKWEMSFAAGGAAALLKLSEEPFDVLVTDMQMPGMDGYTLLREVSSKYPQVVRIVLSGYSGKEGEVREAQLAQSYLSKPCGSGELVCTVENLLPPQP